MAAEGTRIENRYSCPLFSSQSPRVPWYAKLSAVCVVAYALSPIDLIPDFIPVIGYLDDLILLPLGIALTIQMIPSEVLSQCRAKAQARTEEGKALGWIGAIVIIALWILAIGFVFVFSRRLFFSNQDATEPFA